MSTIKTEKWLNLDGTENYKCRAWVNFNGVGVPTIRSSGNVSSLVDVGAGIYRINFTSPMPHGNCAVLVSISEQGSAYNVWANAELLNINQAQVNVVGAGSIAQDVAVIALAVIG